MGRRVFSREFKIEAVRLVVERGVRYEEYPHRAADDVLNDLVATTPGQDDLRSRASRRRGRRGYQVNLSR